MTAGQLKLLLDSFVALEEREFAVCFATRRTRRVLGTYRRSTRMITIVKKNNKGPLDVVATGLHELAHHLTWEKDQHEYYTGENGKGRWRCHGKNFFLNLHRLSAAFNERYRKHLNGAMLCDPHRPAQSPFYLIPEEWLFEIIFEGRRFTMDADAFDLEPESGRLADNDLVNAETITTTA